MKRTKRCGCGRRFPVYARGRPRRFCDVCRRARTRTRNAAHYAAHRDAILARHARDYATHRVARRAWQRAYARALRARIRRARELANARQRAYIMRRVTRGRRDV